MHARFADRDMMMRYTDLGIGHRRQRSSEPKGEFEYAEEEIPDAGDEPDPVDGHTVRVDVEADHEADDDERGVEGDDDGEDGEVEASDGEVEVDTDEE